jgi:hypothetical protein
LIKTSEKEGVSRVVLIQHHLFYGWNNKYMTDTAKKYPDRFRVVGMVDDTKPKPDVAMRRLLKQRVTGFRITSWIRGKEKWLEGPGMKAMWKCGAETGQAMCCLMDPADLPAVDKMCKQHPEQIHARQGFRLLRPGQEKASLLRFGPDDPATVRCLRSQTADVGQ